MGRNYIGITLEVVIIVERPVHPLTAAPFERKKRSVGVQMYGRKVAPLAELLHAFVGNVSSRNSVPFEAYVINSALVAVHIHITVWHGAHPEPPPGKR